MDRLHLDAKTAIATTSIAAWNALMRADPEFGRYALTDAGRATFLTEFTIVKDGKWTVGGKLHRVGTPGVPGSGGPARMYANGRNDWYEYGELHRIDGPAIVCDDDSEEWYEYGELHRIDGPAIICPNDANAWYEHGKRHRIGGPAVTYAGFYEEWYEHGRLHRIGGPAVICASGYEAWYEHGKCHRIGGPDHT